jgi:hypothetical protein
MRTRGNSAASEWEAQNAWSRAKLKNNVLSRDFQARSLIISPPQMNLKRTSVIQRFVEEQVFRPWPAAHANCALEPCNDSHRQFR